MTDRRSGYDYEYTGEIEGMLPGVGLVERGEAITPSDAGHEERIKATGLFKRVKRQEPEAQADGEKPRRTKTADTSGKEGQE